MPTNSNPEIISALPRSLPISCCCWDDTDPFPNRCIHNIAVDRGPWPWMLWFHLASRFDSHRTETLCHNAGPVLLPFYESSRGSGSGNREDWSWTHRSRILQHILRLVWAETGSSRYSDWLALMPPGKENLPTGIRLCRWPEVDWRRHIVQRPQAVDDTPGRDVCCDWRSMCHIMKRYPWWSMEIILLVNLSVTTKRN